MAETPAPSSQRSTRRPGVRSTAHARRVPMLALTALVSFLMPSGGAAGTSLKDIQVGVRGIGFLTDPPSGRVPVAVIFDAQNKASEQDALAIEGWVNAANLPKMELAPKVVDVHDLDRAAGTRIAIVARGLDSHFGKIFDFSRRNGTLTITADLACVRSGNCILGVATEPNVEVIVNRQASQECGLEFVRAFRMMVKEY